MGLNLHTPAGYNGPGTIYKQGVVRFATVAEATAGVQNNVAVTPASVKIIAPAEPNASTTVIGVLRLATNAEAVTGTNSTAAIVPSSLTARLASPGPIGETTPGIAAFQSLQVLTTAFINGTTSSGSGSFVTTSGNFTTSSGTISTASGDINSGGDITAATTITAGGDITSTGGNVVISTLGDGVITNPVTGTSGTGTIHADGRTGRVVYTPFSLAAATDATLILTNSTITGSGTQIIYSLSGVTTGAALSIKSVTNSAGSSSIVITNGTGATTSTADLVLVFQILN